MKRHKNARYVFRGIEYKSFKEMKTKAYFTMGTDQEESGYMMVDDEIWIEYQFNKAERRIICRKKYDYEEQARINWNHKQLKLW